MARFLLSYNEFPLHKYLEKLEYRNSTESLEQKYNLRVSEDSLFGNPSLAPTIHIINALISIVAFVVIEITFYICGSWFIFLEEL